MMRLHSCRVPLACPHTPGVHRAAVVARCEPSDKPAAPKDVPGEINEDVLAKLRAYEEENKKLKEQLSGPDSPDADKPVLPGTKIRVDGKGMKREGFMFSGGKSSEGSWLSESDVDFFTSGGSSEGAQGAASANAEADAIVRRRLLISAGLGAGIIGLSLIPSELLDGSASKPLYEYLVPLLRSIALLDDLAVEVEKGDLDRVQLAVDRILNRPNNIRNNLYSAIEYISPGSRQAARESVGNFVDLVQQADYNKYFDSVGPQSGQQMAAFSDFSLKSIKAAANEGRNILKMFPYDAVNDARDVLSQY